MRNGDTKNQALRTMKQAVLAGAALVMMTLVGCGNDAQSGAAFGAAAGAGLGAIIGHQSGETGEGAAVGAAAGGVLGYIFGNESDKAKANQRYSY